MSHQNMNNPNTVKDLNVDPKTGILGSHPVATGVGAVAAGAAAGAAGGLVAGPVGAVAGAAVGAVVGGVAGNATAEAINPTIETKFWHDNHASKAYAAGAVGYNEFAPAYQYGWESYTRRGGNGTSFDSVESDLGRGWDKAKGASSLGWDKAKSATREAWDRVQLAAKDLTHSTTH